MEDLEEEEASVVVLVGGALGEGEEEVHDVVGQEVIEKVLLRCRATNAPSAPALPGRGFLRLSSRRRKKKGSDRMLLAHRPVMRAVPPQLAVFYGAIPFLSHCSLFPSPLPLWIAFPLLCAPPRLPVFCPRGRGRKRTCIFALWAPAEALPDFASGMQRRLRMKVRTSCTTMSSASVMESLSIRSRGSVTMLTM